MVIKNPMDSSIFTLRGFHTFLAESLLIFALFCFFAHFLRKCQLTIINESYNKQNRNQGFVWMSHWWHGGFLNRNEKNILSQ